MKDHYRAQRKTKKVFRMGADVSLMLFIARTLFFQISTQNKHKSVTNACLAFNLI